MPNQKISELTTIVTVDNAVDLFPIVDTSANTTKKITPTALKSALALDNVNNTSDANKPVSTAQQDALNLKAPSTGINATAIADGSVTSTEFQYINSLTSNAQTQIDAKTAKLITTNRQIASYTLVLSDADKLVEINNASANNLTVPTNGSVPFATGTQILLAQYGAGQTTIVATSGVTIRSNGGKLKLNAQYSGATLIKIDTNEWYLFGDIAS